MAAGNLIYVGKSRLRRKYKRKKYSPENNSRKKSGKRYQQVPPLVPQEVPKEVPLSVISRDYHLLKDPDIDDGDWTRLHHGDESASTSSGYSSDSEDLLPRVNFDDIELRPKVSFISNMSFGFEKLASERTSCLDKLLDPTTEDMQLDEPTDEQSMETIDVEMVDDETTPVLEPDDMPESAAEETKPFVSKKRRKKSPRDFLCCAIM